MFVNYRTLGLVLKKEDRGEADQLFTIYTKDFGRLEILGKAIRKISSKLRSGIEVFYLSDVEFIQGKIYKTLTDAISIEKFQNLRKDLERLKIAYQISEVFDNFVKGEEPDESIWQLLVEVFQQLNNLQLKTYNLQLIYYYFFWNLISILGYKPELYLCTICQQKLKPEKLYFSEKTGGIVCQNCGRKTKTPLEVRPEIVKILRIIINSDWRTLSKIKLKDEYLQSLNEISKAYENKIV